MDGVRTMTKSKEDATSRTRRRGVWSWAGGQPRNGSCNRARLQLLPSTINIRIVACIVLDLLVRWAIMPQYGAHRSPQSRHHASEAAHTGRTTRPDRRGGRASILHSPCSSTPSGMTVTLRHHWNASKLRPPARTRAVRQAWVAANGTKVALPNGGEVEGEGRVAAGRAPELGGASREGADAALGERHAEVDGGAGTEEGPSDRDGPPVASDRRGVEEG